MVNDTLRICTIVFLFHFLYLCVFWCLRIPTSATPTFEIRCSFVRVALKENVFPCGTDSFYSASNVLLWGGNVIHFPWRNPYSESSKFCWFICQSLINLWCCWYCATGAICELSRHSYERHRRNRFLCRGQRCDPPSQCDTLQIFLHFLPERCPRTTQTAFWGNCAT